MSFSTLLIRTVGIGSTALCLRETHIASQEYAAYSTREEVAQNMSDLYLKHNVTTDGSTVTEDLKERYLEWRMNDRHIPAIQYIKNRVIGYLHGFAQNIIPIALGVGAMFAVSESKIPVYRGSVPKPVAGICAIALGLIGLGSFTKNVLGWRSDYPKTFM